MAQFVEERTKQHCCVINKARISVPFPTIGATRGSGQGSPPQRRDEQQAEHASIQLHKPSESRSRAVSLGGHAANVPAPQDVPADDRDYNPTGVHSAWPGRHHASAAG